MLRFGRGVVVLFCLAMACAVVSAQQSVTQASLAGQVVDPVGALIRHAAVRVTCLETNQVSNTVSDDSGRFRFSYLPVGSYDLLVSMSGFGNQTMKGIRLTVGSAFDITVKLIVSAQFIGDSVPSPVVEEDRSEIAGTVQQAEVENLPFEGRNYLDLALLLPGVSATNTASTQALAETSEVVGQGYSVNSQRNFSNSFVVDGLSANDDAAGVAGNVFGMDVVNEFQVVTSGGQAEFGRAMGGYFNLVTKSGTNQLHGTAYGFLLNQRMNAQNALSRSSLPLTQGQYGASLSAPIVRDRTFVFGNFEEGRLNTDGVLTVTPANASAINNRLMAVGYAAPLLAVGTGATTAYPTTLHTDKAFVRVDQRYGESGEFNARYSLYQLSSRNARGTGGLNEVSNGTSVYDVHHTIAASNVVASSWRTVNETRGQWSYDSLNAPPNDELGPAVTISGVAVLGRSTSSPTARVNDLYEVVDNVVLQGGVHTLKAGVQFLGNQDTITYPQSLRGSYSFSSLATFMSGAYNSQGFTQNFGSPTVQQGNPNVGFYAQDEWKVTPALTVNAGVRYDLEWLQTITTDANNVSPRLGVAWSPFGNQQTVVRASFGMFYDRVPLRPLANALLSANNTTDSAQAQFLSYTFSPGDAGAPVFPAVASAPPVVAKPNYALMDRHIQNPYSQQMGLELEQQLGKSATLGLSYEHLRGRHLISSINTNINVDGTRPDVTRGNVKPYSSIFDSQYDGFGVSFLQRPVSWGSVRVSYTWSKAMDDVGEFFFSSPINNSLPKQDRSRSDDDQRNRVSFDATLTSLSGAASGWSQHVTHGWRLGGILQYTSRLPFNIVTGANTKQATTQRPCVAGYSLTTTNPCTEALPGAVIGRNAGAGFDFFVLQARLSRTFALTEHVKLEGIAEAFNALNHRNDMVPNATWGTGAYPSTPSATFGQATAVGDPRNVELGLRLSF